MPSRLLARPSKRTRKKWASVGVSLRRKRTRGAERLICHISRSPSWSQSTVAMARPSSGKSRPETAETFPNRLPPEFRKTQLRSRPLNEAPSRSIRSTARNAFRYPPAASVPTASVGDCDTTCRQKKLHKSSVFWFVKSPLVTSRSSQPSLLRSKNSEPQAHRPMVTPAPRLTSRNVPTLVFSNREFPLA